MGLWTGCVSCGGRGGPLCQGCVEALEPAAPIPAIVGVETVRAIFDYSGAGRAIVAALKFRNRRWAVGTLARALAVMVPADATVITWIPTSPARRRARGFDQAEVLARRVSYVCRTPVLRTMRRNPGTPQTGANREQRLVGPSFSSLGNVVNQRVVLVDDVITTGSTIRSAAEALHYGGADAVHAIGLAFTSPGK